MVCVRGRERKKLFYLFHRWSLWMNRVDVDIFFCSGSISLKIAIKINIFHRVLDKRITNKKLSSFALVSFFSFSVTKRDVVQHIFKCFAFCARWAIWCAWSLQSMPLFSCTSKNYKNKPKGQWDTLVALRNAYLPSLTGFLSTSFMWIWFENGSRANFMCLLWIIHFPASRFGFTSNPDQRNWQQGNSNDERTKRDAEKCM